MWCVDKKIIEPEFIGWEAILTVPIKIKIHINDSIDMEFKIETLLLDFFSLPVPDHCSLQWGLLKNDPYTYTVWRKW